jgi:hypothetical protein
MLAREGIQRPVVHDAYHQVLDLGPRHQAESDPAEAEGRGGGPGPADLIVRDDDACPDVAGEDETRLRHREDDYALAILDDHLGNACRERGCGTEKCRDDETRGRCGQDMMRSP